MMAADPRALKSHGGALEGMGPNALEGGIRGGSEGVRQNASSKMTVHHEVFSLFSCKMVCKGNLRKEKDQHHCGFRHYMVYSLESHLESSSV